MSRWHQWQRNCLSRCCSPETSRPRLLPRSLKDCSMHLCLFFCSAYRVIINIFALGRPRGSGWRGRWAGGSGWGTHVNPWLFHFNVWQNPLQKKKTNTHTKETACQCSRCKRLGFNPWVEKIPWRRIQQPTSVFLPGESRGWRNLVGYSPLRHKQVDMTEAT